MLRKRQCHNVKKKSHQAKRRKPMIIMGMQGRKGHAEREISAQKLRSRGWKTIQTTRGFKVDSRKKPFRLIQFSFRWGGGGGYGIRLNKKRKKGTLQARESTSSGFIQVDDISQKGDETLVHHLGSFKRGGITISTTGIRGFYTMEKGGGQQTLFKLHDTVRMAKSSDQSKNQKKLYWNLDPCQMSVSKKGGKIREITGKSRPRRI